MSVIKELLVAASEQEIARQVGNRHNEARLRYSVPKISVANYREFENLITDYYLYHYSTCVGKGGGLSRHDALQEAIALVEDGYRRTGGNINSAFHDASTGTNGGVGGVLNLIADGLRMKAESNYLNSVFDRFVARTEFDEQVELIRQFFAHCSVALGPDVDTRRPDRYARDYRDVIKAYLSALQGIHRPLRRM